MAAPASPAPGAPTAPPAGRYGPAPRPGARRRTVAGLVAAGLVMTAVAVWLGLEAARSPVTWQDVGFRLDGASSVEVVYDVSRRDPAEPVRCRLQALDARFAQVGVLTVDVPPSQERTVRLRTDVATSEQAVTGVVETCWVP